MKQLTLALALVGLVLLAGVAVAAPGPIADADRPGDGRNSPWITGDEDRLAAFQARFGLTDAQMADLRAAVAATDGDPAAIRATVTERLESFGVENPELGPDGGQRAGDVGRGTGNGYGPGDGTGPVHDGRGPGVGDCPYR